MIRTGDSNVMDRSGYPDHGDRSSMRPTRDRDEDCSEFAPGTKIQLNQG